MVARPLSCDPSRLRLLLEDRLEEDELAAISVHLESCRACREGLERMAAESRWWGDARLLASDPATNGPESGGADGPSLDFLDPPAEPGQLGKLGPYEVIDVIGRGGMGLVLKAYDRPLGRHVAIKVLAPELATSASARRRFAREAQAAAAIAHDHIVAIHAVDTTPTGLPYIVMQYVSGRSLQDRLDTSGPLELQAILRIGMQAASGLAAAHAVGLVHRDIKPANILLENCVERVKLTDFGLARAADDASLTQSGVVAGTPQYMAPEQARGESIDHRADLFSLGSVLYTLCTGRSPFRAETTMGVLRRVSEDHPRPIRETRPEIPDWLQAIIAKLQAKDPADRFTTAAEVAALFERCLAFLEQPGRQAPPFRVDSPRATRLPKKPLWIAAALVVVIGLGAAEASGTSRLTAFVATVLRIRTPEGILVVKLDDPEVKIRVDGEEVVFTDAGPQEIRLKLRAGDHWVEKSKGDRTGRELVTITRGGKQTVSATLEPEVAEVHASAVYRSQRNGPGDQASSVEWVKRLINKIDQQSYASVSGSQGAKDADFQQLDEKLRNPVTKEHQGNRAAKERGESENVDMIIQDLMTRVAEDAVQPPNKSRSQIWSVAKKMETLQGKKPSPASREVAQEGPSLPSSATLSGTWKNREPVSYEVPSRILSLAVSAADGTFALGCTDGVIRLFMAGLMPYIELEGQGSSVQSLAFSPQADILASGGANGVVRLWDVREKRIRHEFQGHFDEVTSLSFSPHGETLATGSSDRTVRLWDVATGKRRAMLEVQESRVCCVAFQPIAPGVTRPEGSADSLVTATAQGNVRFWRSAPGREGDGRLEGSLLVEEGVIRIAFSPDGKLLAISPHSDREKPHQEVTLVDTSTRMGVPLKIPFRVARTLAFSPDSQILAVGGGSLDLDLDLDLASGDIFLGNLASKNGDSYIHLRGLPYHVGSLAFTPDGKKLLSTAVAPQEASKKVELRTLHLPSISRSAKTHHAAENPSAVNEPGARRSTGEVDIVTRNKYDNRLEERLMERQVARDAEVRKLKELVQDLEGQLRAARSQPPGTPSEGVEPRFKRLELVLLERKRRNSLAYLNQLKKTVRNDATDPTVRYYALRYYAEQIQAIDLEIANLKARGVDLKSRQTDPFRDTSGNRGQGGQALREIVGAKPPGLAEIKRGDAKIASIEPSAAAFSVAVSPDGETLAVGCFDGSIGLWDLHSLSLKREWKQAPASVRSLAFSPDGSILASCGGDESNHRRPGEVKLWDVRTGKILHELKGHSAMVWSVAFSFDGKTVATGSADKTARLWDVATGKLRAVLEGHSDEVRCVAFTPWNQGDASELRKMNLGPMLATASFDGYVRFWYNAPGERHDGGLAFVYHAFDDGVGRIAFSPDGLTLAMSPPPSYSAVRRDEVILLELSQRKERARLKGHRNAILALAFSPDGKRLATGGGILAAQPDEAGEILIWDVRNDLIEVKEIGRNTSLKYGVESLAFTPDGEILVSGGGLRDSKGEVRLWQSAPSPNPVRRAPSPNRP